MEMLGRDDDQIKYLGMQNRYMAQAEEKYGKGMGVSPRTMKSALNRAKDAELEKFLAAIEEMKTRGADDKKAVPEYFSIRQLSLDCQ